MGHDPPHRSGSTRIRVALWLGLVVAAVPVILGATGGGERPGLRTLGLHALLALPLWTALFVAWRKHRLGAAAYFILGAAYAGGLVPGMGIGWSLVIVAPLFVIAWLLTAHVEPMSVGAGEVPGP
ncbi:MAG: hypothetical protein HKN73_03935 [Gemmatimonadetes bacterium]|nr:hypothetical protein [Gemmatimonadota bacterium]